MSSKKNGGDPKLAAVFKILQELKKIPECNKTFSQPVVVLYPNVKDDYLKNINKPMDLGTVEKNYRQKIYKSSVLMISDIQLTFKNCIEYNKDSSPELASFAQRFLNKFNRELEKANLSSFGDKNITKQQKKAFSIAIYSLSTVDLGQIITTLEDNCPACLKRNDSNPDEVELDIDEIDPETFRKVESIAKERQQVAVAAIRVTSTTNRKRKAGKN